MRDQHDADCDASNGVLDNPSVVVVRQPLRNRQLLREILCRGRGEPSRHGTDPAPDPVDIGIRLEGVDEALSGPGQEVGHDERGKEKQGRRTAQEQEEKTRRKKRAGSVMGFSLSVSQVLWTALGFEQKGKESKRGPFVEDSR